MCPARMARCLVWQAFAIDSSKILFLREIQLAMAAGLRPGRARKKDPMVISLLFAAEIGCDAQKLDCDAQLVIHAAVRYASNSIYADGMCRPCCSTAYVKQRIWPGRKARQVAFRDSFDGQIEALAALSK